MLLSIRKSEAVRLKTNLGLVEEFGATHEVPDFQGTRRDLNLGKVALNQMRYFASCHHLKHDDGLIPLSSKRKWSDTRGSNS